MKHESYPSYRSWLKMCVSKQRPKGSAVISGNAGSWFMVSIRVEGTGFEICLTAIGIRTHCDGRIHIFLFLFEIRCAKKDEGGKVKVDEMDITSKRIQNIKDQTHTW